MLALSCPRCGSNKIVIGDSVRGYGELVECCECDYETLSIDDWNCGVGLKKIKKNRNRLSW
jgi:hypothetical protein